MAHGLAITLPGPETVLGAERDYPSTRREEPLTGPTSNRRPWGGRSLPTTATPARRAGVHLMTTGRTASPCPHEASKTGGDVSRRCRGGRRRRTRRAPAERSGTAAG